MGTKTKLMTTKNMVIMAMLGALSAVLMYFQISVPFAPGFYKLDFAEVPTLIGTFALGPAAGVVISVVKILLNFLLNGTTTGGVGELSNFIGCVTWVVPVGIIYHKMKTKKGAVIALICGAVSMVVSMSLVNAFITLPFYANVMFNGIENIIAVGTKVNAAITDLWTFILLAVVPFNILKSLLVSVITFLLYKRVSFLIKNIL